MVQKNVVFYYNKKMILHLLNISNIRKIFIHFINITLVGIETVNYCSSLSSLVRNKNEQISRFELQLNQIKSDHMFLMKNIYYLFILANYTHNQNN